MDFRINLVGNLDEQKTSKKINETIQKVEKQVDDIKIEVNLDNLKQENKYISTEFAKLANQRKKLEADVATTTLDNNKKINDSIKSVLEKKEAQLNLIAEQVTKYGHMTDEAIKAQKAVHNLNNEVSKLSTEKGANSKVASYTSGNTAAVDKGLNWSSNQEVKVVNELITLENKLANSRKLSRSAEAQALQATLAQQKENIRLYQQEIKAHGAKTPLAKEYKTTIEKTTREIATQKAAVKVLENQSLNVWERLIEKAQEYFNYAVAAMTLQKASQGIRQMVDEVIGLDGALVELRKVTDLEGASLDNFIDKAYRTAEGVAQTGQSMIEAATEFAKSGYNPDAALELGNIALMYGNIADEEVSAGEAANFIIAQMKAFNIEAQDAMHIIDAVNEVSNNFAVSSADIANNLGKASAVMANAGNSMEEYIAMMTAITEITRSADKAANGLKTLTLRLQGMDDEGVESLEVQAKMEELFNKLGISVYKANGELKNTYEIMGTLAPVYETLTNAEKAYVTETIAGKYQAQNAAALLQNWTAAVEANETALNSQGSAMNENAKVLDSIEGKINAFQSAFQKLSTDLVSSDLIKGIVDLGTGLLKLADNGVVQAITKLALSLATVKLAITGWNKLSAAVKASTLVYQLNTLALAKNELKQTSLTAKQKKQITQLLLSKNAIKKDTGELTKATKAKIQAVLATTNMTKAEKKDAMAKITGAAASKTMAAGTLTLKGAIDALTASMAANPIGAILVAATALISIITSITNAIQDNKEEQRQALQELGEKANETYSNAAEAIDEEIDNVKELRKELDASNITQSEAKSVKEDLLKIQDKLIDTYGDEARGIDLVNGKLDEEIEKIRQLKKEDARTYLNSNASNLADIDSVTVTTNMGGANLIGVSGDNEKFLDNLFDTPVMLDGRDNRTYSEYIYKQVNKRIEELTKDYNSKLNSGDKKGAEAVKKQIDELTTWNEKVKEQVDEDLKTWQNGIDAYVVIDDTLTDIAERIKSGEISHFDENKNLVDPMSELWNRLEEMKKNGEISDIWADNVYEYFRAINADNWDKIGEETERAAKAAMDDYQKTAAGRTEAGRGSAIDALFSGGQMSDKAKEMYDSFKNIADRGILTTEAIEGVIEKFDEFQVSEGNLVDSNGNVIGSLEEIYNYFNKVKVETESGDNTLTTYSKTLDTIKAKYDMLTSAVDEYNNSGFLSAETLQKMMDNNLLEYLTYENGKLVANTEALYNSAEAARIAASQKLSNAMADDMLAIAEGRTEDASKLAQAAVKNLGDNAETAGNQASTATGKFVGFAEAVDQANKALSGKELTDDIQSKISAVQNAYKPYFDLLSKPIQINKLKYTTEDKSSSKSSKEWWEDELDKLKDQFNYNEITIEEYINGLDKLLGKTQKGSEAWKKINEELQKQRLSKVEDDYKAGRISLEQYIAKLKELLKAYKEGTKAWNDLAEKIKKGLQDQAKETKSDYDDAKAAIDKVIDDEIKKLKEEQDALKDKNDETERAIELARLQEALENAKRNKNKRVWNGSEWVWMADQEAIDSAQKALDDFLLEDKVDEIQKQIDDLTELKNQYSDVTKVYDQEQQKQQLIAMLGANAEADILNKRLETLNNFKNKYIDIQKQIAEYDKATPESLVGGNSPSTDVSGGSSNGSGSGSSGSGASLSQAEIDRLAKEVIQGKYGNGQARKNALGANYSAVQTRVNQMLSGRSYASGGIVDYTGLAMLHGSPSRPEVVMNYDQIKNLMASITRPSVQSNVSGTGQSVIYNFSGDFNLPNVDNAQKFLRDLKAQVNIKKHSL